MVRIYFSSLLSALCTVLVAAANGGDDDASCVSVEIPSAVQNGTSVVQFTSSASGMDAPKVHPINGSAFDWWYFDVVPTDPSVLSSVVVTFFTSSQAAFPLLDPSDTVTVAYMWVTFPNGTIWSTHNLGTSATVVPVGDTSSGNWHGTGLSWEATSPSTYLINVDAPGAKGTITFRSVAPGHYPCGKVEAGQNMEVGPGIGWANAVSDAASVVDLQVGDTHLTFDGVGYHDKNWGVQKFTTNIASWYWGHGRVGPYSVVWFDFLDRTGKESVSAYAALGGQILAASCTPGSIQVRPTGPNATYPPVISTPDPTGYHIDLDMGSHGKLEIDVAVRAHIISPNPEYARLIGNMTGTLVPASGKGKNTTGLTGTALFEQFKLTL